jgi:hypothetical protein
MLAMTSSGKRDSMDAAADVASKLHSTHLHSSTAPLSSKKQPLGLTTLPASVRNKIYAHLLDTELVNAGQPNVSYTHTIKNSTLHFAASRAPFPVETALFYVNKQISEEARHFFYSKNLFVRFEVYSGDARHAKTMLEDSGVLFSVAGPDAVERCTMHAMDLKVVEKGSAVKRTSVLFPAQYLPRLVNFMEQASKASGAWAPAHALAFSVVNMYGLEKARVQGDLLELFRLLSNVGKVEVEGTELLAGYADALQRSMMAAAFEADAWLNAVNDMTDRAEQAQEAGLRNRGSAVPDCHDINDLRIPHARGNPALATRGFQPGYPASALAHRTRARNGTAFQTRLCHFLFSIYISLQSYSSAEANGSRPSRRRNSSLPRPQLIHRLSLPNFKPVVPLPPP